MVPRCRREIVRRSLLIEKWLEQVVVAFIDHDDMSRRVCQRIDGGQPAESRADDNNARHIRLVTHGRVIPQC